MGLVALVFLDPQLMIIPCFLLSLAIFAPSSVMVSVKEVSKINLRKEFLITIFTGFIAGELLELFAILSNLAYSPEERIKFYPDPFLDLFISIAYYLPIAIILAIFLVKVDINYRHVFLVGGIYGILTEQNGVIFLSFNIIAWLYVAIVYGSFLAIPAVIRGAKLRLLDRKKLNLLVSDLAFTYFPVKKLLYFN